MSLRREFVALAQRQSLPFSQLCERFSISRKTGYKWLHRAQEGNDEGFSNRSRRPHHSPAKTAPEIEDAALAIRQQHPAWGGRKISRVLQNQGFTAVPAPSTVTHILHRHGLILPQQTGEGGPYQRFEHEHPNQLWQMDFKGWFRMAQGRCDPLTVIDDHSRYNLTLEALQGNSTLPVQATLIQTFRRYGLPERINMDNGQPWGSPRSTGHGLSTLCVWMIRLGVKTSFSRPAHPQTNGKDERFHRSLKAEVLRGSYFENLQQAQHRFDQWRYVYNHERPHEGINMAVPADRYHPSYRTYPEQLPAIEYPAGDLIRKVGSNGDVSFKARFIRISKGLRGQPVGLRARPEEDGIYDIYYCKQHVKTIDLKKLERSE